jgi:uncharacterized membrane protein
MRSKNTIIALNKNRLESLADGLFAIVMTLLVLELSVPAITGSSVSSELTGKLIELWPKALTYILSFILLGLVWGDHHAMFHYVVRSDGKLAWMNIILLMFVALVPFSTSLLGSYSGTRVAAVIYGINFLIILGMHWLMWRYINREESTLTDKAIGTKYVVGGQKKGYLFGCISYAIGICIAFINPFASICVYAFLALIRIIVMIEPKLFFRKRILAS